VAGGASSAQFAVAVVSIPCPDQLIVRFIVLVASSPLILPRGKLDLLTVYSHRPASRYPHCEDNLPHLTASERIQPRFMSNERPGRVGLFAFPSGLFGMGRASWRGPALLFGIPYSLAGT
jgi:hypothetical protein